MKKALVGYTGFVGSNIAMQTEFDGLYNSKNVEDAYNTEPDLLVFAGLRAEKYLANSNAEKDMELIKQAERNIMNIHPKKLVLISTVDVYDNPQGVSESSTIIMDNLQPYGYNRYCLEQWVREEFPDALVIRLPALYGKNIKKNFIYDFINVIPFMLKKEKMLELSKKNETILEYYILQENDFYRCRNINSEEQRTLRSVFKEIGFSALNFTDSRNRYQFYPLRRLWNDIEIALLNNLTVWNPATEPVLVSELYEYITGEQFKNEIMKCPVDYNYKTEYATLFGGINGYIMDKEHVMDDIRKFINSMVN